MKKILSLFHTLIQIGSDARRGESNRSKFPAGSPGPKRTKGRGQTKCHYNKKELSPNWLAFATPTAENQKTDGKASRCNPSLDYPFTPFSEQKIPKKREWKNS